MIWNTIKIFTAIRSLRSNRKRTCGIADSIMFANNIEHHGGINFRCNDAGNEFIACVYCSCKNSLSIPAHTARWMSQNHIIIFFDWNRRNWINWNFFIIEFKFSQSFIQCLNKFFLINFSRSHNKNLSARQKFFVEVLHVFNCDAVNWFHCHCISYFKWMSGIKIIHHSFRHNWFRIILVLKKIVFQASCYIFKNVRFIGWIQKTINKHRQSLVKIFIHYAKAQRTSWNLDHWTNRHSGLEINFLALWITVIFWTVSHHGKQSSFQSGSWFFKMINSTLHSDKNRIDFRVWNLNINRNIVCKFTLNDFWSLSFFLNKWRRFTNMNINLFISFKGYLFWIIFPYHWRIFFFFPPGLFIIRNLVESGLCKTFLICLINFRIQC